MNTLYLADLEKYSEEEIKDHLADNYAGSASGFDYGNPSEAEKAELRALLENFSILAAYESVGSWGCDSSSWFLLKEKTTGALFEVRGSHCSCYGFEGQFDLEHSSVEYLKSDKFYFHTGGYDDEWGENTKRVKEYLQAL